MTNLLELKGIAYIQRDKQYVLTTHTQCTITVYKGETTIHYIGHTIVIIIQYIGI